MSKIKKTIISLTFITYTLFVFALGMFAGISFWVLLITAVL